MSKLVFRTFHAVVALGLLIAIAVACSSAPDSSGEPPVGPNNPDPNETVFGTARFEVSWSGTSVPAVTQSIGVTATPLESDAGSVGGMLNRPATRLELEVPVGLTRFTAVAYSERDGSGITLATAEVTALVLEAEANTVVIRFPDLSVLDRVEVMLDPSNLRPGGTSVATAVGYDAGDGVIENIRFVWASSDMRVATVSSLGEINAHEVGRTTITATEPVTGISGSAVLAVTSTTVVIESITLGPGTGSVPVGSTLMFQAQAFDAEGELLGDTGFEFLSADPQVLSVDDSGRAQALGVGTAFVRVLADGLESAAEITVTPASNAPAGASWEMTTVPSFAEVTSFDIAEDGRAYALVRSGDVRLWTSPDGGSSWYPIYSGDLLFHCGSSITSVAVVPNASDELMVRCGTTSLIRSSDRGMTWQTVYSGSVANGPVFHPGARQVVFADNSNLVSLDAGITWRRQQVRDTRVVLQADPLTWIEHDRYGGELLLDGEPAQFLRTNDGGESWEGVPGPQINSEECTSGYYSSRYAHQGVSYAGDLYVLVLENCQGWPERYRHSLLRLNSGSDSWALVFQESNSNSSNLSLYNRSLYFSPAEPETVYALASYISNSSIMLSRDRGASWSSFEPSLVSSSTLPSSWINISREQPGLIWATSGQRAFSTDWGATWSPIPSGSFIEKSDAWYFFGSGYPYSVGKASSLDVVEPVVRRGLTDRIGIGNGIGIGIIPHGEPESLLLHGDQWGNTRFGQRTTDLGETWVPSGVSSFAAAQSAADPNRWYFATELGNIRVSNDAAQTYRLAGSLPNNAVPRVIAAGHSNPDKAYALTNGGVYRTDDAASTWVWASTDLTHVNNSDLVVDPTDDDVLYVSGPGVFKSVNGGEDWTAVSLGFFNVGITALAISPDGRTLYAGSSNGSVYRSLDAAHTWEWVNSGFESYLVQDIVIDPSDDNVVYVSTTGGVYKSVDKGSNWRLASSGMTSPFATWLAISADGNTIYVGTSDHGIYRGAPSTALGDSFATAAVEAMTSMMHQQGEWSAPSQTE